jgi:hypothetical protein
MDFSRFGKKHPANCESCEFYQQDDYTGTYSCTLNLDEDEMVNFIAGYTKDCKYYRFYDEYKSVQKQI